MNFSINNKKYSTDEEISIYDFLVNNKIIYRLPDELCFVEVLGYDELVNAKEVNLFEDAVIKTNSKKVYNYIHNNINCKNLIDKYYRHITLDPNQYNILLCEADYYSECVEKYKDFGFNDILNDKFAQMIYIIEMTHQLLNRVSKRIDSTTRTPLLVSPRGLVKYSKKYNIDLRPIDEIAAELIKNHFKNELKIEKEIRIVYITSSISHVINYNFNTKDYNKLTDDLVLMDNFDIDSLNINSLDNKVTNHIYIKENKNFNQSCNYNGIFMILHQMGFVQEELDISTTDLGKKVIIGFKDLDLSFIFTNRYITEKEIKKSECDMILVSTKKTTLSPGNEEEILSDYNINQIYRRIIVKPGNKEMFRRY